MRAELIRSTEGLDAIEKPWRELALARGNAFVTPEWFKAWWRWYGDGHEPAVAVVRDHGGGVVGVVPFVVRASRPRLARFAGAALGDRFHPACAPERELEVVRLAIEMLRKQDREATGIVLDFVDDHASWGLLGRELGLSSVVQRRAQLHVADLTDLDWEGYLAGRSRNFRSQLRRREKVLRRDHEVSVREAAGPADLENAFSAFLELHDRRWSERGTSALASTAMRGFLRDFAASAAARGWLRLRLLMVDDEPVASFLGWNLAGSYAFYQGGFDPAWADRSVGIVLHAITIRDAIAEGAHEYDLLLGDEAYKLRFADRSPAVCTLALAPAFSPTRLAFSGEAALRRAWHALPGRQGGPGRLAQKAAGKLPSSRGG